MTIEEIRYRLRGYLHVAVTHPGVEVCIVDDSQMRPIPWTRFLRINLPPHIIRQELNEIIDTYKLEVADVDRQVEAKIRTISPW